MTIPLWAPVLLPVFFGILAYTLPARIRHIVAFAATGLQVLVCALIFAKSCTAPLSLSLGGWNPPVGIMLVADRFSATLCLLAAFVFLMLALYESRQPTASNTFYMLFLVVEGLICGLFLLDDLFSIFVLIEVSTIVVALLIMFKRDSRSMYDGMIYLLINIFSATFLLFGLALLYKQTGTFSLVLLTERLPEVENTQALYLPYAMILTAVSLKAALMPLFSWLPKAHGTPSSPTVVSAMLSGLYVKSGIYLFIRCQNAFSVIDTQTFFLIAGMVTAIVGFTFAIAQSDIKLILSYHTVSQLGLIMVGLSMGDEIAMWGSIYHIINHAIFKTALFLGAGVLIDEYKTRNIYEMKGALRRLPFISAAMIAAILGITGAPLFNGSISKYLIAHGMESTAGDTALLVINLGTIVSFVKFSTIFSGSSPQRAVVDAPRRIACVTLGVTCLLLGVLGAPMIRLLFGVEVHIDAWEYVQKSLVYLASVGVAWLIYRYLVKGRALWQCVRAFDLGFNAIAMTVVVFFCVLVGYLYIAG